MKPYILATECEMNVSDAVSAVREKLLEEEFEILGDYSPAGEDTRRVLIVTHDELIDAVQQIGGFAGFAAAQRIACTWENGSTYISYVDPEYIGNAYFQKNYPFVENNIKAVSNKLKTALKNIGSPRFRPFGSEDGLTPNKLQKYHYMFGMEYFEDVVELNTFNHFEEAKSTIEANFNDGNNGTIPVYSIEIPDKRLKLYGVGLSGERGESHFLPIIDINTPKHSAFLPYEILVMDNEVVMLHGRYRIALSFPDLTMMTFGRIMSTPGDIEDYMQSLVER
ncbi:MAG: hypothetical protein H8E82_00990 [Candidatus Marinimicrobia bacterium]|nr:hypothetical protein [Candidatus Neomarinimicrobiota bacterium]